MTDRYFSASDKCDIPYREAGYLLDEIAFAK